MTAESWKMRSHSGYYLGLARFGSIPIGILLELATRDERFTVTAACGCVISADRGDHPPCTICDCCESCCLCDCELCGAPLHAQDDCLDCLAEPENHDDIDHTKGVLGDLDEQVRELS